MEISKHLWPSMTCLVEDKELLDALGDLTIDELQEQIAIDDKPTVGVIIDWQHEKVANYFADGYAGVIVFLYWRYDPNWWKENK